MIAFQSEFQHFLCFNFKTAYAACLARDELQDELQKNKETLQPLQAFVKCKYFVMSMYIPGAV